MGQSTWGVLFVAFLAQVAFASNCKLLGSSNSKPFPSLTQCYKYNQGACCVSAHDDFIKGEFEKLLSETCRREYPSLEYWYCLACNPDQPSFVDSSTKEVRVCQSYANKLFSGDTYDNCGLNDKNGVTIAALPSDTYNNVSMFMSSYPPPYFSDHTFVVVNDGDNCFAAASRVHLSLVAIV